VPYFVVGVKKHEDHAEGGVFQRALASAEFTHVESEKNEKRKEICHKKMDIRQVELHIENVRRYP